MEPASDSFFLSGALGQLARRSWWTVLLVGVYSIALGVFVLAWPAATLLVVGVLFGSYLVVSGVLHLFAAFGTHAAVALRVLAFISGAVNILLGLFCFRGPLESILLLALWIGIAWLFRGIAQVTAGMSDPSMPARGWQVVTGLFEAIAGVILLVSPFHSIAVLTLLGGIWLLVLGGCEVVTAFFVRRHGTLPTAQL